MDQTLVVPPPDVKALEEMWKALGISAPESEGQKNTDNVAVACQLARHMLEKRTPIPFPEQAQKNEPPSPDRGTSQATQSLGIGL